MTSRFRLPALLGSPWFWGAMALIVRLAYVLLEVRHTALFAVPLLDEQEVADTAESLLESQGFGQEPLFRAPGYPVLVAAIMAIFGEGWPVALRVFQALAGAALVVAGSALARTLAPAGKSRPLAALLAGLLLTIHGPAIRLEATVSLDGPAAAAFAGMMSLLAALVRVLETGNSRSQTLPTWMLWRPVQKEWAQKLALGAGSCAMVLAMLRPTVVPWTFLVGLILLLVILRRPGRRGLAIGVALLITAPTLLAGAAVTLRNGVVTNEWRAMPLQGGFNLREANRLDGPRGRYLTQRSIPPLSGGSEVAVHPLVRALRDRPSANPTREIAYLEYLASSGAGRNLPRSSTPFSDMDRWHQTQLLQSIRQFPMGHGLLYAQKLIELHSDREIFNYEDYPTQAERSPFLSVMAGRVGVLLPLAALTLGLVVGFPSLLPLSRLRALLWVCLGTMVMAGLTALGFSSGRMRMPLIGPWAALAGCAPLLLAVAWSRRSPPLITGEGTQQHSESPHHRPRAWTWAWPIVFTAMATAVAWQNLTGVHSEVTTYHDLGRMSNAAWHAGQKLENQTPPGEPVPESAFRRYHEALVLARQARISAPKDYPIPIRLEAQALSALGQARRAADAWRASAALLPADSSIQQNLATTIMMDLGQTTESIPIYREAIRLGSTEARFFLAMAHLRLAQNSEAAETLRPFAEILRALETQPATPRQSQPLPARAVIAASLLAQAQGRTEAAQNLASYLGPRGRLELLREQQFLPAKLNPTFGTNSKSSGNASHPTP